MRQTSRKKRVVIATLDSERETYVVHVAFLGSTPLNVYPSWRPQISGLIAKEVSTKVFDKYANFMNMFFPDLASKFFEHSGINNHAIKLVNSQQPPYKLIYSLGPVKLETLKTYIKTNLANNFIRPSKSPAGAFILFDQKLDSFFCLCVNY